MRVEIETWLVHIYHNGEYRRTIGGAKTEEGARRYVDAFNLGDDVVAVARKVVVAAEVPDRLAA